jgi:signal transduction histidine kinase
MNIRTRFHLIVFLIPVILVGSIAAMSALVIIPEYSRVESAEVVDEMSHVENLLYYMLDSLDTTNWDWSSWDDMYVYMADRDPGFIDSNYVNGTFIDSEINIMVIVDTSGEVVFGRYYDLETEEEVSFPGDLVGLIADNSLVNTSGFLVLDDLFLMYSSRHILTSFDEGPSMGSHLMAKVLNDEFATQLSFLSRNDVQFMVSAEPQEAGLVVRTKDDNYLTASKLIEDVTDTQLLSLFLRFDRSAFSKGTSNLWGLLIYLGAFGIFFIAVSHYITDKLVLIRLSNLSVNLEEMVENPDLSMRLPPEGTDEIGLVSSNVNKFLGSLEEARDKELSQRDLTEETRKNHYNDLIDSVKNISDLLNYEIVRPLNSLRNVAFVLREENNVQLAEIIESSLRNADKSLHELSNLTFMGELRRIVTDVNEIIGAAVHRTLMPNNITVKTESSEEFIVQQLDASKMTRVYENIIKNAVESMPGGGVLSINVVSSENEISVSINDTGRGMSEEELADLFQPFYTNKENAIGFGLVYARQVIEAHSGSITISSEKGKGTSVTVTIPRISSHE